MGIAEDYVLPMLPRLLRSMHHRLPSVELSVVTGLRRQLCQHVDARSLDMAVVTLTNTLPKARTLAVPSLHWVAAPSFVPPTGGLGPLLCFPKDVPFALLLTSNCHERGALPHSPCQCQWAGDPCGGGSGTCDDDHGGGNRAVGPSGVSTLWTSRSAQHLHPDRYPHARPVCRYVRGPQHRGQGLVTTKPRRPT